MAEEKKPFDFTFQGTVKEVGEVQTFASGFMKRQLVLDNSNGEYPNPVPFQFLKDNVKKLDGIRVGMVVKVGGYFNGRAWDNPKSGKRQYFCDNSVYGNVEIVSSSNAEQEQVHEEPTDTSGDDDMPF